MMYLPKITDDILFEFCGQGLIEFDGAGNPQWTQTAVDFIAMLQAQEVNTNCDAAVAKELVRQNHRLAGYSERELAPFYQDELAG